MSYSTPQLGAAGIEIPSYSDRLENLIAGYKQIFGEDVYIQPDTMDYQLLSIFAKGWDDLTSVILDVYNARNPNFASDTALDTLVAINGIKRKHATCSTVVLKVIGEPGAVLEAGAQARDDAGNVWQTLQSVTFLEDGETYVAAACTVPGATAAGVGTITEVNTPVSGWYEVTNEEEAILGRDVETDAELRLRRSQSIALPSVGMLESLKASLLELTGVETVNMLENDTHDDGMIPAHSFCAVVQGGSDREIAGVIRLKKAPGISTYGNVTVPLSDENGVEHQIQFSRPSDVPVTVKARLRWFSTVNPEVMSVSIPEALKAFTNLFSIGEDLIVPLLYGVIFGAAQTSAPTFSIVSLSVSRGEEDVQDTLSAAYNELFTLKGIATVTKISPEIYEIEVS